MGCVATIGFNRMPKQGPWVGKKVDVYFHYDTSKSIRGEIIRDDTEQPYVGIIKLEDGRFVLDTECQMSMPK
jgi:hypothetical protein